MSVGEVMRGMPAGLLRGVLSGGGRQCGGERCGIVAAALVTVFAVVSGAHAQDHSLLDLLRDKKILTDQEVESLRDAQLPALQRTALVEVLRRKGVLTAGEAASVSGAAASAGAASVPAAPALQQSAAPVESQAAAPAVKAAAPSQVGYDDGFFVRSADGNFALRWNGRVVTNLVADDPDTAVRDSFTVDRARLGADATFYKYFRTRLEGEFASSAVLRDAYLAFQPRPDFNLQIGQFTVPFGYELNVSKLRSDFVERAAVVTQSVNPRRDIGVMVYGALLDKTFQYQLAVMNGAGQNRSDNNSAKDVVGRLVVSPFVTSDHAHLKGLSLGGSLSYGSQPAEFAKDAGGNSKPVANSIFGASETGFTFYPALARRGERLRAGGQVAWFDGPLSITSEYIHTSEERSGLGSGGADLSDLETDGAYIGGTWLLTGEPKTYNARVRPSRPLWSGASGGWGAWELALRYEFFELGHDADSASPGLDDNRYDAALAGINWYPTEFLRLSLDYIYSVFDEKGANASPDPDKHSNNALLGRAQVDF